MMDAASSSDWQTTPHAAAARYYRPAHPPDARHYYPSYASPMAGYAPPQYAHASYGHHAQVTPQQHMHGHQMTPMHSNNVYGPNSLMESYISSSSTRLARNFAEKQRRTKLNTYIDELRSLVPMVSSSVAARSGKKVDKTSILRLSATFLRMHQILYSNKSQLPSLPPELSDFNWSQFILDDLDGVMLLVTSAGKIVFITHTIDKILGHNQTDLFGQSLYSFTCPEDHDELRKNLSPDLDPANLNPTPALSSGGSSSSYCGGGGGDLSSGDEGESCGASSPQSSTGGGGGAAPKTTPLTTSTERQRRSFYLRLRVKGCSRSEKPQYELVHVGGHLRITRRVSSEEPPGGTVVTRRSRKSRELNMSSNDVVLVAVIKPFKERRVTDLSLIESTREEYITRHLRDGRIIYCDHRISYVSGYLASEVSGLSGFMFMHKEDMKWSMIALRQMFIKSESYGSSCYRLIDKTGKFIYLKTYGYLEFDPHEAISDDYFPSFICVNTLLSEEEGEQAIATMKQRFTPLIQSRDEPGTLAIAESLHHEKTSLRSLSADSLEPPSSSLTDPDELKDCVRSLISNLPPPSKPPAPPSPCALTPPTPADTPYHHKLALAAKSMPPASVQTAKMGLKSKSNVTTLRQEDSRHRPARKEEVLNAPTAAPPVQNRPSVLRGPIKASERGAGPKRPRDEDVFADIEICDKRPRASYEGGAGALVSPQSSSSMSSYCQSPDESHPPLHSTSTYLNLDMQDGMDMASIIEAPSFIGDEESEEELKRTPVHSSEMFELWEDAQVSENITSLDKTSLRLPGLEFSSLNSLKQRHHHHHHKPPNNGASSPSLRHSFPS